MYRVTEHRWDFPTGKRWENPTSNSVAETKYTSVLI
jgi:hypothetical protein